MSFFLVVLLLEEAKSRVVGFTRRGDPDRSPRRTLRILTDLLLGLAGVDRAIARTSPWSGAITCAMTEPVPRPLSLPTALAFLAWTALRTDSTILVQASLLTGCAFFLGLWWTTVAVALPSRAGTVLCEGCTGCHQSGSHDNGECLDIHNCHFRLLFFGGLMPPFQENRPRLAKFMGAGRITVFLSAHIVATANRSLFFGHSLSNQRRDQRMILTLKSCRVTPREPVWTATGM